MIEIRNLSKKFDEFPAVIDVSMQIKEGNVFGLIGTNGAGKSTVLRMVTGILKPDEGEIFIDGTPVYENMDAKKELYFIPDEPYFFATGTARDMEQYVSSIYEKFDKTEFYDYLELFGLDAKRKIATFSKGMKKQLALLCGICAHTKYLICDETFDGLDPVMRQGVKSIFVKHMDSRGLTPIIASHNLRELEDICDHVGLLHKGGILLAKDLEDMKCNIHKVQCVFASEAEEEKVKAKLDLLKIEKRGSLITMTVRGGHEETVEQFAQGKTVFFEVLPLSLEEIFISETEVVGYDIKKLILG
ncbi:MAG: ABC transporter ATP-binding protein [Eubacteriales bacterium]